MNKSELQQLKMAWIAAREAGNTRAQIQLLHDHPEAQEALSDFIVGYAATSLADTEELSAHTELLPLTQRAMQTALGRVFDNQLVAPNLTELRTRRGMSLVTAARGLRLGADVWKKFEQGAIELVSLSERQLERLASFFEVSAEQFGLILNNSQPQMTINRRQNSGAARSEQQSPKKQSFAEALEKSGMSREEKKLWLEQ
ncbi:MAG TPA: helix-turn-helix transcriptional regulator [Ktedonobacteraceae bacterium]|nr:helix-turn-helix transcriptional regulator [Ktedonobacteraceae bacterium]